MPYNLIVKQPDHDMLMKVTEFAKKTGDYSVLSLTDLTVMALTYQLEKEFVGTEHLKEEPATKITIFSQKKPEQLADQGKIAGFYYEKSSKEEEEKLDNENSKEKNGEEQTENEELLDEEEQDHNLYEKLNELSTNEENVEEVLVSVEGNPNEEEENEDEDDDDEGWITPSNIKEVKRNFGASELEEKPTVVACITTDFSMQNVLKQIGLNIAALDGRVIKHARTFILRCYACYKTTTDVSKIFCPKCGNKTLKRVAVSLDENGQHIIHINSRKVITAKYKNQSIPAPKGGKHATNPILFEDQPLPQQRISAKARAKTNALGDDYIAGYSPFVMRDVDSKSAMLRSSSNIKQFMKNYEYDNYRKGYKK